MKLDEQAFKKAYEAFGRPVSLSITSEMKALRLRSAIEAYMRELEAYQELQRQPM